MEAYSDPSGYVEPVAFYNENDPFAAAWLRELIKANLIAPGVVDERSIEDIKPDELLGYTQCHFFAGIGGWSYALRQAGWPDDQPVWTGSCPCQPFSTAGKRVGTSDERHLWPAFFHLIEQCRPTVVFGEQVEAAIRQGWLDLVQDDMEGIGYAFAAAGIPAASVGAPHLRARLYFVGEMADTNEPRSFSSAHTGVHSDEESSRSRHVELERPCTVGNLADTASLRRLERRNAETSEVQGNGAEREGQHEESEHPRLVSGGFKGLRGVSNVVLGDTGGERLSQRERDGRIQRKALGSSEGQTSIGSGDANFWTECDWLYCRDEKYRPVESQSFPLAHGIPNRVGKLRGYGNAIVAPLAQAFIESYLDTRLAGA